MAIMPNCRILSYTTNRLHSFTSEYYANCLRPKGCIFGVHVSVMLYVPDKTENAHERNAEEYSAERI